MSITYVPDWNQPIIDDEGRQTREFNEWVREVSDLLEKEDILEQPSYASAYWVENTDAVTLGTQDAWNTAGGTFSSDVSTSDITVSGGNFDWNGTLSQTFLISINATVTKSATSAGVIGYEMGFFIEAVAQDFKTSFSLELAEEEASPSLHTILTLAPGDGVQPIFRWHTGTGPDTDIIVPSLNFTITSLK